MGMEPIQYVMLQESWDIRMQPLRTEYSVKAIEGGWIQRQKTGVSPQVMGPRQKATDLMEGVITGLVPVDKIEAALCNNDAMAPLAQSKVESRRIQQKTAANCPNISR